jgi:DNA-binding transcriptional regulator YiaG
VPVNFVKYFMKFVDFLGLPADNDGGDSIMATATQPVPARGTKARAAKNSVVAKVETENVAALRRNLSVTQRVMAMLLGVTERTLNTLEAGGELSPAVQRRVIEIGRLYAELATVVKPDTIGKWLIKANDAFDGHSAVDLIASGKIDRLWKMIFMLRSGVSS